jgi:flavin-dependent dehydrogenase
MYDLAIIGAGPAGATLARLAGERHRVLLVDKRPPDNRPDRVPPGKCCGGLLAPDAQRLLSRLGLGLPREVLVSPQIFVVRAIDLPTNRSRYYQRFYLNMDRGRFDAWLRSLVPPKVEVRLDCGLAGFAREDGHFRLTLKENDQFRQERARVLVGADGAFSKVRRLAFTGHPTPPAYLAIQERVEAPAPLPYFSALFDPAITDFYAWTIPKDGHLLIGAALKPGDDTTKKFSILREKLKGQGYQLGETVRREGAWILRPVRLRQIVTGGEGVALVGEAAGFISPSSAEGLSYAMASALILAEALNASLHGFERRYARRSLPLKLNILLKNLKSPFMYNPFLRGLVMAGGLNSLRIHQPQQ